VTDELHVTRRQLEILGYVSRGLTRVEIADQLGMALDTTKTHVARLYRCLEVTNAPEAVRVGFERGLLVPRQTHPTGTWEAALGPPRHGRPHGIPFDPHAPDEL
jgi:DNA-binding CsgD family transcriptional regulator